MAPKKKADETKKETAAEEQAAKKRKTDGKDDGQKKDVKKEEEPDNEKEKDAVTDKRPVLKETVIFDPQDATLNVLPTANGKMLMAHADGGMQYFIAGARANVGIKAGRYMFEARIVEHLNPTEVTSGAKRSGPTPRQLVRLGVSTVGSELVLGESVEGVCFDSDGMVIVEKKKLSGKSQRFGRDNVMAVVLNLDAASPNANTVSLFKDGLRISEPYPLPESLVGKPLYPHVSYRNVSLQMNLGPHPLKALSFKCKSVQSAANADVIVAPSSKPKSGKYEVVFPIGFPDEGTFDWVDAFHKKNPRYVELSDRKIIEWAGKSGMHKAKGLKESNDKPEFNYGIPGMDDCSVQRVIKTVAPLVPRNYVIMEVKENLVAADRTKTLQRFAPSTFKRIASVQMGEPTAEYKELQQELIMKAKQEKANVEWRAKRAEKERKKQIEIRQKQLEDMRKKAEEGRKRAAEDLKKKAAEESKKKAEEAVKKDEGEAKEEGDETKDEVKEEVEEEGKPDVKEDDEQDAEMKDEDDQDNEPPAVELTTEEKATLFRPVQQSDLTPAALGKSFGDFTLPEKSEGFDEIRYEWQSAAKSKDYLRTWVLEKKRTSRIEDLQPSKWFQDTNSEWLKTFKTWEAKQKNFKAQKAAEEKKRSQEDADDKKDDDEVEDLDIFSVEDVCNVGNGEPLFASFGFEDWALLQLRYEMYLLAQAYKKDVDDAERVGIHDTHISFYYNKYFHKQFNPKNFGHSSHTELCDMIKDTVIVDSKSEVLVSQLSDDVETVDIFVKLTEEQRRERQRRLDAGDETARLKFTSNAMQQPQVPRSGTSAQSAGAGGAASTGAGASAAVPWGGKTMTAKKGGWAAGPSAAATAAAWKGKGGWGL